MVGESGESSLYVMDCLELLTKIPDGSIDLVVIDPPYYRVMLKSWDNHRYDWDNQWSSREEYIGWIGKIGREIYRVLDIYGSFYIFADDKTAAYIQVELDRTFTLQNMVTWHKPNNMTIKGWRGFKSYAPVTEKILFYSKLDTGCTDLCNTLLIDSIRPMVDYMKDKKARIMAKHGMTSEREFKEYIDGVTDTRSVASNHYFTESQYVFPSRMRYEMMQRSDADIFTETYDELKERYDELREIYNTRARYDGRCFAQRENYTDVWAIPIIGGREALKGHPTQKPLAVIERIVDTSSRPGDTVLDCFMGSGTTAVVCKRLGRRFIGCDSSPEYVELTRQRLALEDERVESGTLDEFL